MASVDALRQQPPFRFVSEARCRGDGAEGRWRLDGSEPFFAAHFPGDPVVPGVLIVEALAQLASLVLVQPDDGAAAATTDGPGAAPFPAERTASSGAAGSPPLLVSVEMRFRSVVRPPAVVELQARLDRAVGALAEFEVRAHLEHASVAEGRLALRGAGGARA